MRSSTAAWTNVDDAKPTPIERSATTRSPAATSRGGRASWNAYVLALSTDYVFDGEKGDGVRRSGTRPTRCRSTASRSSRASSSSIRAARSCASWACGRHGSNAVKTILRLAHQRTCASSPTSGARRRSSQISCVVTLRVRRRPAPGNLSRYRGAHLVRGSPASRAPRRRATTRASRAIKTAEMDPPARNPAGELRADNAAPRAAPCSPHYREVGRPPRQGAPRLRKANRRHKTTHAVVL